MCVCVCVCGGGGGDLIQTGACLINTHVQFNGTVQLDVVLLFINSQ